MKSLLSTARALPVADFCSLSHGQVEIGLEWLVLLLEFPNVKTLTVDDQKRIRIPDAKPRQVFAYQNNGDGTITLTAVKAEPKTAFPKGSLAKYFTGKLGRERDELETALLKGTVQGPE